METFSALLALCAGNSPVTGEFPSQRPVTWSFDVFFDLRLNNRLNEQSWGWWFETPSHPSWRHCNVNKTQGSHRADNTGKQNNAHSKQEHILCDIQYCLGQVTVDWCWCFTVHSLLQRRFVFPCCHNNDLFSQGSFSGLIHLNRTLQRRYSDLIHLNRNL